MRNKQTNTIVFFFLRRKSKIKRAKNANMNTFHFYTSTEMKYSSFRASEADSLVEEISSFERSLSNLASCHRHIP